MRFLSGEYKCWSIKKLLFKSLSRIKDTITSKRRTYGISRLYQRHAPMCLRNIRRSLFIINSEPSLNTCGAANVFMSVYQRACDVICGHISLSQRRYIEFVMHALNIVSCGGYSFVLYQFYRTYMFTVYTYTSASLNCLCQ